MKINVRLICLAIALIMLAGVLAAVIFSIGSLAEGEGYLRREETVYVELNEYGFPNSMVSSVYLSNGAKLSRVTDHTSLTEIRNVMGSAAPEINGEAVTFQADGEDVCYQGVTDKELPFSIEITYKLNGKPVTASELTGASGSVTIGIKTGNRLKSDVEVDGETVGLYTPFTIVCFATLSEGFSNIRCENAKQMQQAGEASVVGLMFPGLGESLGVTKPSLFNEEMTIEADVDGFEMNGLMFIALNGIFDEEDVGSLDKIQELAQGVEQMRDASNSLIYGAGTLENGAREYADGLEKYMGGLSALEKGLKQSAGGAAGIADGVGEAADGAAALAEGAGRLRDGIGVFKQYTDEVAPYLEPVSEEEALRAAERVADSVERALGVTLTPEQREKVVKSAAEYILEMNAAIADSPLAELAGGVNELYDGAGELYSGIDGLQDGLTELEGGARGLSGGLEGLANGSDALTDSGEELQAGIDELYSAIGALRKGLKRLGRDGVTPLAQIAAELNVSLSRKDALMALSKDYRAFTGNDESVNSAVQFVLNTPDIFVPKPLDKDAPSAPGTTAPAGAPEREPAEEGFFNSIARWFSSIGETIRRWFQ